MKRIAKFFTKLKKGVLGNIHLIRATLAPQKAALRWRLLCRKTGMVPAL
jgi:hypothetical protein